MSASLKERLEGYLSACWGGETQVTNLQSLSGGACQENYLVELDVVTGPRMGHHDLVLRTDKGGALLNSLSRADEFVVARAAWDAGVRTPQPRWLERDPGVLGSPFYLMEKIAGRAQGRYVVKDRELTAYRERMPTEIAQNLAAIHSILPGRDGELDSVLGPGPAPGSTNSVTAGLRQLRRGLDDLGEAHPALELGMNWMRDNAPVTSQAVLVHGDFRTGNFMVSPAGLHGIVDWEFAHWGDPHEDLSWLCMRDWRFGKNNREVGGFADRAVFYAAYKAAGGAPVDPVRARFWEIFGNAAWSLGAAQQARRHLTGQDRGIEYASIGRRSCEMEWELMRLIEDAG